MLRDINSRMKTQLLAKVSRLQKDFSAEGCVTEYVQQFSLQWDRLLLVIIEIVS